jgi:hypothetical protein
VTEIIRFFCGDSKNVESPEARVEKGLAAIRLRAVRLRRDEEVTRGGKDEKN